MDLCEKKVQRIKAEKNISFAEAYKAATGENESRLSLETRTVAEVVSSKSEHLPPATRSIKTQTNSLGLKTRTHLPRLLPQHASLRLFIHRIQSIAPLLHRSLLRWHLPLLLQNK